MIHKTIALSLLALILPVGTSAMEMEVEGEVEFEYRGFWQAPQNDVASRNYGSIATELEIGFYDTSNTHAFIFKGFARGDSHDAERSHSDLREAKYRFVDGDFEAVIGLDKVFWGVTEFVHLVDIINQTDASESIDGEQKLGQPMLRASYVSPVGTFTAFYLPVFRERHFVGRKGRPSGPIEIDNHQALYESEHGDRQHDIALRYNHFIGQWDIGVAYFDGTAREPILSPTNIQAGRIVPFYPLREQVSLDAQATIGPWLLKLEALTMKETGERSARLVTGIEYSFYGIFNTASDLGMVAEYMWDERDTSAPHPFNNDLGIGLRWTANDSQSTTLLAGAIIDLDHGSAGLSIEAERRLTNQLKVSFETRFQTHIDQTDATLFALKDEDFARLRLTYYF